MKFPPIRRNEKLTDDDRRRLKPVREQVRQGLLGGDLDGVLTLADFRRLEFYAWLQWREHGDADMELSPERQRALLPGILERIESDA